MKLLCVDLDGTLLDSGKNVSSQNLEAIERMVAAGHKFAIVTGRPLKSALRVARDNGLYRPGMYVAAFNGGQVVDCRTDEIIREIRMPMEYAEYVFKKANAAGLHIHTYNDTKVICGQDDEELRFYLKNTKLEGYITEDPLAVLDKPPIKLIVMSMKGREVLEEFRDGLAGWSEGRMSSIFSHPTLLEYSLPEISKGNAIHQLAALCGVEVSDTIACGDEENDLSMIEQAGVGVAMKNATDIVKRAADYVTLRTNDEDGISEVIEKFILV